MKNCRLICLIFCILFMSVFFSGCNTPTDTDEPNKLTSQIFAMDTVIDLTAYGEKAQSGIDEATKVINNLDKLLSVTNKDSDVYKLNNSGGNAIWVNDDTYNLITAAKEVYYITDGRFDITVYPLVKLWGFTTEEHNVPPKDDIAKELEKVGLDNITLFDGGVANLENGAQIDLGGIAKGFIADKAAQAMKDAGVDYGIISIGGNVRTVGTKPSGENFNVGIKDSDSDDCFATLAVDECSVITSGAYQRNFTKDGKTYHHIIDPKTGYPAESDIASVTIIGKDGAVCDALSTALFIGGSDYAPVLEDAYADFEYVILTKDKTVIASESLKDKLTLENNFENLKIVYK